MQVFLFLVSKHPDIVPIVVWVGQIIVVVQQRHARLLPTFDRDALIVPNPRYTFGRYQTYQYKISMLVKKEHIRQVSSARKGMRPILVAVKRPVSIC